MIEPKSQKIFAEIEIKSNSEEFYNDHKILELIYRDFYQKCVWINQMYPYNRSTLSTYDIMFNIFGFEDRVLGDVIWATHDTFDDSNNFFKDYLFGGLGKSLFGKGEWPIIYWYRYRHPNPDINDCVTYTISR